MSNIQIAQALGVSEATVSRVINNRPGVSSKTTDRVLQAAAKLGYQVKPQRSNVGSTLRHNVIGVLVLSGDIYQKFSLTYRRSLDGAEHALGAAGIEVIRAHPSDVSEIPARVLRKQVDGLVLAGTQPDAEMLKAIAGIPCVWICSRHNDNGDTVLTGNHALAEIAANYLIDRGHSVLAAINPLWSHPAARMRFDYFQYIADRRGAKAHVYSLDDRESARDESTDSSEPLKAMTDFVDQQIDQILKASPRPTGIFASLDIVSAMVYASLLRRGVQPGKDMLVIGCDNDPVALTGLYPRPATIDIAPFSMGKRAVHELLWRIANPGEEPNTRVVIEPRLIPGEDD